MTARIINQRTGAKVETLPTYEMAAERRLELRRQLDPTKPCPYAIRTEEEPVPVPGTTTVRQFLQDNIGELIATIDAHEAGIYRDRAPQDHYCRTCNWRGTEAEWQQHVAERMADRFTVQLELML